MTGRVSHKKTTISCKRKRKNSQAVARRNNKVIVILTCSLFEKCTRMAQRQYLERKSGRFDNLVVLFLSSFI